MEKYNALRYNLTTLSLSNILPAKVYIIKTDKNGGIVITQERKIKILMEDGCTRYDAKKFLKKGTIIYEDLESNFENYIEEWFSHGWNEKDKANEIEMIKKMIKTKVSAPDWGIVVYENNTYYIQYTL